MEEVVSIPVKTIGPVKITGPELDTQVRVPLATYETPMWPSTNRGASVTQRCGGVHCIILDDRMTRSILLEGPDALAIKTAVDDLQNHRDTITCMHFEAQIE